MKDIYSETNEIRVSENSNLHMEDKNEKEHMVPAFYIPTLDGFTQNFFLWTIYVNLQNEKSYLFSLQEKIQKNLEYNKAANTINSIRNLTSKILCTEHNVKANSLLESLLLCLTVASKNESILAAYYLNGQAYLNKDANNTDFAMSLKCLNKKTPSNMCSSSFFSITYLSKLISGESIIIDKNINKNKINIDIDNDNDSQLSFFHDRINIDNNFGIPHDGSIKFFSSVTNPNKSMRKNMKFCLEKISSLEKVFSPIFYLEEERSIILSLVSHLYEVVSICSKDLSYVFDKQIPFDLHSKLSIQKDQSPKDSSAIDESTGLDSFKLFVDEEPTKKRDKKLRFKAMHI